MKNKRIKMTKYESEDTKTIKSLIFIIIGISVLIIGLYFLTDRKIQKDNNQSEEVVFDYTSALVGMILNRPYDEYYVLLYNSEDENASSYVSLYTSYSVKEDAKKIYLVDLSKNLDNKYLSDKSNLNVTNIEDLKVNGSALLLVNKGKITKTYEKLDDYKEVLK